MKGSYFYVTELVDAECGLQRGTVFLFCSTGYNNFFGYFVFYFLLLIGILCNVIQSNSVDPVTQTLSFFLNFFHIGINVAVWSQV